MSAFDSWLTFVWRPDFDGQPFHVTEHDTGAGTSWGVTQATWDEAVSIGLVHGTLQGAPKTLLAMVLNSLFWRRCRCDDMHPAVGGVVFNIAMLDGPGRAAKILQASAGAPVDRGVGIVGPITLHATNAMDPKALVDELTDGEEAFTAGLSDAKWFDNGWHRRAEAARTFATTFLSEAPET